MNGLYKKRKRSPLNIYHVMARGVGKQIIFETDNQRYNYLLGFSERYKGVNVVPYAWCLMDNHVHFLLEGDIYDIALLFKSLHTQYAMYFNYCCERAGGVFQRPFKTEAIDSERYFLTVLRYIHLNPEAAGMAAHDKYLWSSYHDYASQTNPSPHPFACETQKALGLIGSTEELIEFHEPYYDSPSDFRVMDIDRSHYKSPEQLLNLAKQIIPEYELRELKSLPRERRNELLQMLVESGLSLRQVERLTGVSKTQIARILG